MIDIDGRYFMPYDYEDEIWKSVKGYSDYKVSNLGRVKDPYGKIVNPIKRDGKYYYVALSDKLGHKNFNIEDIMRNAGFKKKLKVRESFELKYDKNDLFIYNCF